MKAHKGFSVVFLKAVLLILVVSCGSIAAADDLLFSGGVSEEINYTVAGSVIIEDANVIMYEPAHIQGAVITSSGSVLDVYGGQIDLMMLISTSNNGLPEGQVTVYGTDFAVDDVPVASDTTELFLPWQKLSGTYYDGTPFSYMVSCYYGGSPGNFIYQTVKLGWIEGQPQIALSNADYDFGQVTVGSSQPGEITIYNLGDLSLNISEIALEQSSNLQFVAEQLAALPLTLEPDELFTLGIDYKPVEEGPSQALLSISSDDPNSPVANVLLSGEGMPLSAIEQSAQIIKTFELALTEESISGIGNQKSATNKTHAFAQMLLVADELLLGGYDEYALETLMMIEAKCDGLKSPKDFITGQGAVELNALLNELIDTLQEQIG
jgi:hypothetical protein